MASNINKKETTIDNNQPLDPHTVDVTYDDKTYKLSPEQKKYYEFINEEKVDSCLNLLGYKCLLLSILYTMFLILFTVSLYYFFAITYDNNNTIISTNSTSDFVIKPCITSYNNLSCPEGYVLINTALICYDMYDHIGRPQYPSQTCILDNSFCVDFAYCGCYDVYDNALLLQMFIHNISIYDEVTLVHMSKHNTSIYYDLSIYLILWFIIIGSLIILLIFVLIKCSYNILSQNLMTKVFSFTKEQLVIINANNKDNLKKCNTDHYIILIVILVCKFLLLTFLLAASIAMPIVAFNHIKENTCPYVCNDCYYINYTLDPFTQVICATDNVDCLHDYFGSTFYNYYYVNANNVGSTYWLGVFYILVMTFLYLLIVADVVVSGFIMLYIIGYMQENFSNSKK